MLHHFKVLFFFDLFRSSESDDWVEDDESVDDVDIFRFFSNLKFYICGFIKL